ncbi:MAG: dTDP-4-dehydrorhamnose 3,5-epimerase [Bacteroidales bacterium]|jgi:dTDP-4-dehydrorhamnose 3,5-epimerase|nr:dTDP-4-dehydrorhamnose 3,5-epimerase [Bacteroidales bacterium]
MKVVRTNIEGLIIIEPKIFEDERGYFYESYNESSFDKAGIKNRFIQDNQSKSSYGVIRGLHMQKEPYAQTKLVRILEGEIFDVAVDLREGSPTFGRWHGIELSAESKRQFLIPKGFCHGFSVLSKTAVITYKCDELYHPESETGILYNDPKLNIDWKIPVNSVLVSNKDAILPLLKGKY